ncbi:MAG: bifunctional adenosylcobinamide kinase/adenosylcobinamide-phosphate guanylyltransferase [Firmicutes bacterium]|nr:bifunctional adenosylcobinamide kinase/adenosylcobinamide-phosphate guanylyltransferase [Bacillota bacterium]
MILIFGGAYQGKLEYALNTYQLTEKDVYSCEMDSMVINFDRKVIADAENFVFACVKEDINPKECFEEHIEKLRDKIIIFDDISQGIVPMDKTERAWREANGRCMTYLGQEADEVIRVFCGIGSKVK